MSVQSAIVDNIIARVEAIVPTTFRGMPASFVHVDNLTDPQALFGQEAQCSRRFIVLVSGPRTWTGHVGAVSEATERDTTFDLVVSYEMQPSVKLAMAALCEDADAIVRELMRTDGDRYDAVNTQMSRRLVVPGNIVYAGNYALVPFTVTCRYLV